MKKLIAILLILISGSMFQNGTNCFGQTQPGTSTTIVQSAQDSLKKAQIEKQKLYRESFIVNASLIDSGLSYVKKLVTIKDAEEQNANYIFLKNCEAFVEILFAEWNRKKKK